MEIAFFDLSNCINEAIRNNKFPDPLKWSDITPVHKKLDPSDKANYRPVSVKHYCVWVWRKKLCNCLSSFVLFFPSLYFFWTDCQKLFSKRFIISYQESVWPRFDSFLGRTKNSFSKSSSSSCYSRRVWHMTQFMKGNQHSKRTKNS